MARCAKRKAGKQGGAGKKARVESGRQGRAGSGDEAAGWVEAGLPVVEEGGVEICWGSIIATLGLIVRRAFEEFERSKQPLETRTTTTRTKQTPRGVEVTETVTVRRAERVGDVRILKTLLQCVDREMRLLKELHGDPKEFVNDLGSLSDAELEALDDLEGVDESSDLDGDAGTQQSSDTGAESGEKPNAAQGVARETADGSNSPKATRTRDPAAPALVPETQDSVTSRTSGAETASPGFPVTKDRLAADEVAQDELLKRLEGWLRETKAFLPAQPGRSSPTATCAADQFARQPSTL